MLLFPVDYAYVANYYSGLVIVDISSKTAPTFAGSYNTVGKARGVAVSGDYAYVADYHNGLVIVDISSKTAPTFAGSYNTGGYANDVAVSGDYAYVADDIGLVIVDISSKTAPKLAGSYNTAGTAYDVAVSGDYAYVADYSGLVIVDISSKTAPKLAGSYNTAGTAHDVAVSGDYAYVADWANGLVILSTNIPLPPTASITVNSPEGGENWQAGTTQTIQWSYTGNPGSEVRIFLLKDGIVDHVIRDETSIGSSGSGSYEWEIQSIQETGYYQIKITSATNNVFTDTSDEFEIIPKSATEPLLVQILSPTEGAQIIEDEDATFSSQISGGVPPYTIMWSAIRSGKFDFVFSDLQNFDMNFYNRYGDDIKIFQPSGDCMISLVVIDSVGTTAISDFVFVHIVPPEPEVSYEVWQNFNKITDIMPEKEYPYEFRIKITNHDDNPHWYSLQLKTPPENNLRTDLPWDANPRTEIITNNLQTKLIEPGESQYFYYKFKSDWDWIPPKTISDKIYGSLGIKVVKETMKLFSKWWGLPFDIYKFASILNENNLGVPIADFNFHLDKTGTTPTIYNPDQYVSVRNLYVGGAKPEYYNGYLIWKYNSLLCVSTGGKLNPLAWGCYAVTTLDQALAYNAAVDPVPDYTEIVQPEPYYIPEIDSIPDGLYKNVVEESFEMLSYSRAEERSYIRYAGAVEDNAYEYALMQLNAAKEYNGKRLEKIEIINNLYRIILQDEKPLTDEQIEEYKNIINTEGLPLEAVSILTREGLEDEIPGIIQLILEADPDLIRDPSLILDNNNQIAEHYSDLSNEYTKKIMEIKVDLMGQPVGDANPSDLEEIERLKIDIQSGLDKGYTTQELKDNIQSMIDLSNAIIIQTNNNDYLHYYSFATDAQVRYLTLQMPTNIYFLPPITTLDQFNLTDGSTLPIKFTTRDEDTDEFIYDDSVKVTITNSTGHLITYFTYGTGTGSVRINSTEEQYIANFQTKDYAINIGETYSVTVTFGEPDSLRGYDITYFTLIEGGKAKGKGN